MEQRKGFNYTLQVNAEASVEEFAKAVLQLVNIKSSYADTILDIKTFAGTNIIGVISLEGLDNVLDQYGTVRKEEIDIIELGGEELPLEAMAVLDDFDSEGREFFIHHPYKGEYN